MSAASETTTESHLPSVTVIVPVRNDAERLEKCLHALACQTYPDNRFEVLVADNGSDIPPSAVVERFAFARLIRHPEGGSYAARNEALRHAAGEIIAFTDSDCLPQVDWLSRGVAACCREENCGLIAGRVQVFYRNPMAPSAVEVLEAVSAFPQRRYVEVDRFGVTANVFTFRHVFDAVGLFNDELHSSGDAEWGRRVHGSGLRVVYADDVVVRHPARHSINQLRTKIERVAPAIDRLRRTMPDDASFGAHPAKYFRLPVGRMVRILRDRALGPFPQRVGASLLAVYVRYVTGLELLRLRMGSRT